MKQFAFQHTNKFKLITMYKKKYLYNKVRPWVQKVEDMGTVQGGLGKQVQIPKVFWFNFTTVIFAPYSRRNIKYYQNTYKNIFHINKISHKHTKYIYSMQKREHLLK